MAFKVQNGPNHKTDVPVPTFFAEILAAKSNTGSRVFCLGPSGFQQRPAVDPHSTSICLTVDGSGLDECSRSSLL